MAADTSQDVLKAVYDAVNEALNVQDVARPSYELIQAATTIHAAETQIGDDIDVTDYNVLSLGLDYTKGDETKVTVILYKLLSETGTARQTGTWDSGVNAAFTADSFDMTATANRPLSLDVSDCAYVQVKEQATGGTPTGTLAVSFYLSNNG